MLFVYHRVLLFIICIICITCIIASDIRVSMCQHERTWLQVPHDAEAVPGGVSGDFSDQESKLRALLGMGFDEATANAALAQSGGHLQTAVDLLLQG